MKRNALLFGALMLGAASAANAQGLTMQMSNGWNFSFAGNVNIFAQYQTVSSSGNTPETFGVLIPQGKLQGFYYGTGLLPAFATFTATGKEGNTDLGVHFGFAPQVQCGLNNHDCFGAQIDMRQVFMTVGFSGWTLTAGKELGVYQRSNILNDQTLFGVGGPVGTLASPELQPGGTTLGRIGYGYVYPNFVAQMTMSKAEKRENGSGYSVAIGLVDPSDFGPYQVHNLPRLEGEFSVTGGGGHITAFVGGALQNSKTAPSGGTSKTAWGGAGGATWKTCSASLHASAYYGRGIGTTVMFGGLGDDGTGDLTKSYGGYAQGTVTPGCNKTTIAGSGGFSALKPSTGSGKMENWLISGGVYHQATKSLKLVFEGDYAWSKQKPGSFTSNKSFTGAFGLMLFY
jgi:hypothetical protein